MQTKKGLLGCPELKNYFKVNNITHLGGDDKNVVYYQIENEDWDCYITNFGRKQYKFEILSFNEYFPDIQPELKSGMVVEFENGKRSLVMLNTPQGDSFVGDGEDNFNTRTWAPIKDSSLTIVKIWDYPTNMVAASLDINCRKLIWEKKTQHLQ